MPEKKIEPKLFAHGGADFYVTIGDALRIRVDSATFEGQPEDAILRLIKSLDKKKAEANGVEVLRE